MSAYPQLRRMGSEGEHVATRNAVWGCQALPFHFLQSCLCPSPSLHLLFLPICKFRHGFANHYEPQGAPPLQELDEATQLAVMVRDEGWVATGKMSTLLRTQHACRCLTAASQRPRCLSSST